MFVRSGFGSSTGPSGKPDAAINLINSDLVGDCVKRKEERGRVKRREERGRVKRREKVRREDRTKEKEHEKKISILFLPILIGRKRVCLRRT